MKQLTHSTWWSRHYIACIILILLGSATYAQPSLPVIEAKSSKVDIRDGTLFQKGVWKLSPQIKPDVYYVLEPIGEKTITFYTDIDSISFRVVPGKSYEFMIVLNQRDTCYTQIATNRPPKAVETNTVSLQLVDKQSLQEDFTLFRQSLEKEHPGLYRYQSKQTIDQLFDSCFLAIDGPMSSLEFGKTILFIISAIQDGHTGTNIPRLLTSYYPEHEKMFPLSLYFTSTKTYIYCSKIDELPAESELVAIDGKPIDEITKELFKYLPSDGRITSKKRQTLNNGAFPILYNLIFGNKPVFLVDYKTRQGESKTVSVAAQFVKDVDCDFPVESGTTSNLLDLHFLEPKVALLTIKTFDESRINGKENFINFLESSFIEIKAKKADKLLLDLRGNGGGADELGALLYSYLATKPFAYFASKESTTEKITEKENPLLGVRQPQRNTYQAKVYFLIDGLCFSTTADFCAIARSEKRGLFIGEETGGGYYGNTSGGRKEVHLPTSGITIGIPLFKYVNAVKKASYTDRGIIPDYEITPQVTDIKSKKDVVLDYTLKLATQK